MPSWGEIEHELGNAENPLDVMRRRYIGIMSQYTGRNVIAYYSGFLQKPHIEGTGIDENDKNAFMEVVCGLDKSKGLDLVLHTPGGDIASTESIVYYLKKLFGNDIRVFVPQIAMSAGTMLALSSKEIVMGKESNLGPIDPQYNGFSCAGIIEEFETAMNDVVAEPKKANIWGQIIAKYHPTFIGDCQKAIAWADSMVTQWLKENMFSSFSESERNKKADNVVKTLSSHSKTYSHMRHIHGDELKMLGLNIVDLEGLDNRSIGDCKDLQDCVLTLHHVYMNTFVASRAIKIVENQNGNAMIINRVDGQR